MYLDNARVCVVRALIVNDENFLGGDWLNVWGELHKWVFRPAQLNGQPTAI
jgi:hypothetical protein